MPILNRKQRKERKVVPEPKDWLVQKLERLAEEWRDGYWYMELFESAYLCYLECWLVVDRRPPEELWNAWEVRCRARLPEGSALLAMNQTMDEEKDRDVLISELKAVRDQMMAVKPAPAASPSGGNILDMLQDKDETDE